MADKFSPDVRSQIMSQIRSKDTKIEKLVFSYLRKRGVYFQKHYARAIGSPDVAQPRKKKAVFIDGEFWHGYTLEKRKDKLPMFWIQKIVRNVKRDRRYRTELKDQGWQTLRVWEHELDRKNRDETLERIYRFLSDN